MYPFQGICDSLNSNWELWQEWVNLDRPNLDALPKPYNDSLTHFQVVLLLKCLADDKVQSAILSTVEDHLGKFDDILNVPD